jgi:hypothetical protein
LSEAILATVGGLDIAAEVRGFGGECAVYAAAVGDGRITSETLISYKNRRWEFGTAAREGYH